MTYTLIRSDRRTLAVQITREGEILVRAPRRCSRREIERFLYARREWIQKHLEEQRRLPRRPEPDPALAALLVEKARRELPGRIRYYGEKMNLAPTGISITGARTRFGSCSGKNRICFSWRLMQYPPEAIDYVVVHELAHLVHKNHGPEFYALVASVLPDYKERRALLRE